MARCLLRIDGAGSLWLARSALIDKYGFPVETAIKIPAGGYTPDRSKLLEITALLIGAFSSIENIDVLGRSIRIRRITDHEYMRKIQPGAREIGQSRRGRGQFGLKQATGYRKQINRSSAALWCYIKYDQFLIDRPLRAANAIATCSTCERL